MNTLIAYASKYGFTRTCAELLAKKLPDKVDLLDLAVNRPNLAEYDTVIIGGSVYMGKIRKPVERLCAESLDVLAKKRLGLFICGLAEGEDIKKEIELSFPKELLAAAVATGSFGGECNYEKMNFMERGILKKITGSQKSLSRIAPDQITHFAAQINGV